MSDEKRIDVIDSRVGRLEDRYLALALEVKGLSTKMNVITFIAGATFSGVILVLIAVFTGVRV